MSAVESRPAPRRVRPFEKATIHKPLWMRKLLGRDPSPTREEYDALVAALWDGDPSMDAVLDWMYANGVGESRSLFEQALERGIESIEDAPEPLKNFFAEVDTVPDSLDWDLIEEVVRFTHRTGLAVPLILRHSALKPGDLHPGFNQAVVPTGALNQ